MFSNELLKTAKENGYELKKALKNRWGYCFEYTLEKNDDVIYFGTANSTEEHFLPKDEIIDRVKNGKSSEEKEREEILREFEKIIEMEMMM